MATAATKHQPNMPIDEQIMIDHQEVKDLYQQYVQTGEKQFYNQFVWELVRHSIGEEIILYPMLEKLGDQNITTLKHEHDEVTQLLKRTEGMTHPSVEFDTVFHHIMKNLEAHIAKEESTELKILRETVPEEERIRQGQKFMARKKIVPTRPHTTPANPLAEEALGLLLAPIDKFRDLFREFPEEQQ